MPRRRSFRDAVTRSSVEPRRPYLALRHRDYRRLWVTQLLSLIGTQMQVTALNWHVWLLTGSTLALGFVGLTRVVPIVALSLWGGVVADRYDRRRVMFATQTCMAIVAAALAVMTFTGRESIYLIYLLNAVAAAAISFDNPARQALIPRLVSREDLPGALSLNLTIFHTAMIAGPALAGLLIAGAGAARPGAGTARLQVHGSGIASIYSLNALSFIGVLLVLATMQASGRPERADAHESPLGALRTGLRFVFSTPILVWTMVLDFFATFFSGAMSLLPVFADRVLGVGAAGYGMLAAGPGLGALVGSIYAAIAPMPRRQGRLLLWSVAAYGATTVVFGLSRSFLLTFIALCATGLADLVSTVIRQTIRQFVTPDALRGRMTSVLMIFFMGGPQLGELEAGLIAAAFASVSIGVTVSVVSGGIATLLVTAAVAAWTPVVRDYDSLSLESSARRE